jgi:hypothetical protein
MRAVRGKRRGVFMNDLFAWALALPSIVIYAICGAIGGVIGATLGSACEKLFGPSKAWRIIPLVFVVTSVQLTTRLVLPWLQPYEAV